MSPQFRSPQFRVPMMTFATVSFHAFLSTAASGGSAAAAQLSEISIEVGEDRPVEIGAAGLSTVEPYLTIDPRDPSHLIAGVFLVERLSDPRTPAVRPSIMNCAALTTFDGGESWLRHDFPERFCLDPWVAILEDGSAVFQAQTSGELFQYRSTDGGRSWSEEPYGFGDGFDHGTLIVDRSSGPFDGSLYTVANRFISTDDGQARGAIFVARSSDGGRTYPDPVELVPSNLFSFPMNPVVLSDGTLVVPFVSFSRPSTEGGVLLDAPPSWVVVSTDGGESFSPPRYVTDLCARGFPELAVGAPDGPHADRLYFVCHDLAHQHVYLHNSDDQGETWSAPVVVNAGSGADPYVQNVAIATNAQGVVAVSWYDARNDPRGYRGTVRCQELFFAASLDGGDAFLSEVGVSSEENCADTPENGETGRRWVAGGDYHGLVATPDGTFHLLWADSRAGRYQLRTATMTVPD